ncbi:hypothetical protein B0H19DRAFT_1366188 [Mycena capillaripes]|nr:hypothetical protein B0H19DRAFT_1366188 [Mycena capillaripes]
MSSKANVVPSPTDGTTPIVDHAVFSFASQHLHPPRAHPSVVPVVPSASPERRVRHAPRLHALPDTRADLLQLHDAERNAFSDRPVPRTPSYVQCIPPDIIRRAAGLVVHAAFVDPTGVATIFNGVTTLTQCSRRAPQMGCAAPPPCTALRVSIPPSHTPLCSPRARDDCLRRTFSRSQRTSLAPPPRAYEPCPASPCVRASLRPARPSHRSAHDTMPSPVARPALYARVPYGSRTTYGPINHS